MAFFKLSGIVMISSSNVLDTRCRIHCKLGYLRSCGSWFDYVNSLRACPTPSFGCSTASPGSIVILDHAKIWSESRTGDRCVGQMTIVIHRIAWLSPDFLELSRIQAWVLTLLQKLGFGEMRKNELSRTIVSNSRDVSGGFFWMQRENEGIYTERRAFNILRRNLLHS